MKRWGLLPIVALGLSMQGCGPAPSAPDAPAKPKARASVPSIIMGFYGNYISQVDGTRSCRFEPTCGDYARDAIRRHGALLGWLVACERLIRYHGDTETYERIYHDGTRLVDPVSDNDFWFARPFARKQP